MPRDANGNYTLPAGNPVVSGTPITSSWANPTLNDIAIEITNSLSRDGEGGMLVPFQNIDGAVGTPGITWTNETKTGLYRAAINDMRVSVNAIDKQRWTATGSQLWNGTTWVDITTGDYLPLTGGTLSGQLTIAGTANDQLIVKRSTPIISSYIMFQNELSASEMFIGENYVGSVHEKLIQAYNGVLHLNAVNADIALTSPSKVEIVSPELLVTAATAINLNAPTTNINGLVNVDALPSESKQIFFRNSGVIQGWVGVSTGLETYLQSDVSDVIIQAPFGDINLNATTNITSGTNQLQLNALGVDDPVFMRFLRSDGVQYGYVGKGFAADASPHIFLLADLGDVNIESPTAINLDAPTVLINGSPISFNNAGTLSIPSGATGSTIIFTRPFPNTNYAVTATVANQAGGTQLQMIIGTKTATTVQILNPNDSARDVNWIAVQY